MLLLILLLAITCNLPVGYIAFQRHALTAPAGLVAAGITGLVLFVAHPLYWILLAVFFGTSTALTLFQARSPTKLEAMSLAEKGGQRDQYQVLANAGIPLLLSIIAVVQEHRSPVHDLTAWYSVSLAMAFAVVNADTWATELGVTSSSPPRSIANPFVVLEPGSSGGVSPRGLLASFFASLLIAVVYGFGSWIQSQFNLWNVLMIAAGGILGSLSDSFLGATLQAQYRCNTCDKMTEKAFHQKCGTATVFHRGLPWFGNDLVNISSVILVLLVFSPLLW